MVPNNGGQVVVAFDVINSRFKWKLSFPERPVHFIESPCGFSTPPPAGNP